MRIDIIIPFRTFYSGLEITERKNLMPKVKGFLLSSNLEIYVKGKYPGIYFWGY